MKFNDSLSVFEYLLKEHPNNLIAGLESLENINSTLFSEVEQLILAHNQNQQQTQFHQSISHSTELLNDNSKIEDLIGKNISHFTLQRLLGSGGMGVVYLAHRNDGKFEQTVAIKIIYPTITALHGPQNLTREAQYLALLNHPNIAGVLDAGECEFGMYMVMEYIEGTTLVSYCNEQKLNTKQRLTLFCKVCDAVSYAHQNRVIHADLKPSNILVNKQGEPKLVDFGVARTINNEQTDFVVNEYIKALSQEYASPEQLAGQTLTTQSDVYSLGKVLASTIKESSSELLGIIKQASSAQATRYATALELNTDIKRYLSAEPISFNTHYLYRCKKFIQRNPLITLLGISLIVACALFTNALWQKNIHLKQERETTEYVADFLINVFESADPAAYDGHEISAQDLLLGAKQRLSNEDDLLQSKPKVALYLAKALNGVGEHTSALELLELSNNTALNTEQALLKAQIHIQKSEIASAQQTLDSVEKEHLTAKNSVQYFNSLANILFYSDQYEQALAKLRIAEQLAIEHQLYTAVITIKNKRTAIFQEQGKLTEQLAEAKLAVTFSEQYFVKNSAEYLEALFTLQSAYSANEDFDAANILLEDIYKVQVKVYPKDHPTLALTLNEIGNNFSRLGEYDKAIPLHKQAIAMVEGRYGKKHIDYAYGYGYLGNAYGYQKRFEEAIHAYNESLESNTLMYGKVHTSTLTSARNLGLAYSEMGNQIKAKEVLNETLKQTLTLYPEISYRSALVQTALARTLIELQEWQAAKIHLEHAAEGFRQSLGEDSIRYTRTIERLNLTNEKLATGLM
ncbi:MULTISPECIES: serine/threonine-protein kinase [unclassified Pseudoalteromonas]|uniref:serine/threonine-protein kinase n=1 Tax=unclassified Pseudoalteromonas TaxID=194690 RepID=UPI0025B5A734|nr:MULTISPECIES: serine/threonine-protein kinase [unclassified Pseudoalteromonas]MDN3378900.1 protein kinase [Pseudoalteromonas sp. APC 3893]MDN3387546.1 protein kinase [Pseudoalteromonas sp. APC 4017]